MLKYGQPIKRTYQDYIIEVFDDKGYNPDSADNLHNYDVVYGDQNDIGYSLSSTHGIKIYDLFDNLLKSVCVCSTGAATTIYKNSFIISGDKLLICCSNKVFAIKLPTLDLSWKKECDWITCFEILSYKDAFIVRGELNVTKINNDGKILWQFAGKDIFISMNGNDLFKIENNTVFIKDWNEEVYSIDIETGGGEIIKA